MILIKFLEELLHFVAFFSLSYLQIESKNTIFK